MTENITGVKTVMSEAIRLNTIAIKLWRSGQITEDEMNAYHKRITSQLIHFWWNDDVEAAYKAIEAELDAHQANHD